MSKAPATRADIKRYRANLQTEYNNRFLYERLAQIEQDPSLSEIFRRLAATEDKHATLWANRLREAGARTEIKVDLRTQILAWMAKRFGPGSVVPSLAKREIAAGTEYDDQPEAIAAGLPEDERSHARLFRHMLGTTDNGLHGGAVALLEGRHRAVGGNALRAGVLGSNDGLVSNLSLVMGVAGASLSPNAILITGLAGMLAGSLSMALGEWISVQSSRELYQNQISVEEQEIAEAPEEEKEELALIYQAKGMTPDNARALAAQIMSNKSTALDTLSREELGIDPKELGGSAGIAAATSFALFGAGAIIPVLPYFVTEGPAAVAWSVGLSALSLFALGAAITLMTGRNAFVSGMRQVVFGLVAAAITYGIGRVIGVSIAG